MGLGLGLVALYIKAEDPEVFEEFMKALKKDEKIERVEIDITPKKIESRS